MPRSTIAAAIPAFTVAVGLAACGHATPIVAPPPEIAVEGRHHDQVDAQVKPFLDAELVSGVVVGLYDAGKTEVYGYGAGPNHAAPDGNTLYELGPITNVYTALLLADAVQRREIGLDTPLAELMPPGVTVPIRDKVVITLRHLALHTAGLPRLPPSLAARTLDPNPFGAYGEDAMYSDLIRTGLEYVPGTQISYSSFGSGLLGFALGKKLGGGYAKLVTDRVLKPLALTDTFVTVPPALAARRATGTTDDLATAPPWTFDALASAGAVVSTARDQLRLIEAELDAAAGGALPLRHAMKLTQEPVLDRVGSNEGLGWMIDSAGRYAHTGSTGGFHAYVGFDPKTKHGVVVLASTATTVVDRIPEAMYKILDGESPPVAQLASAADLAKVAGSYELSGSKLAVTVVGKRLYLDGPGEPRRRLASISAREFWIEGLQAIALFQQDGDKIARLVFGIGERSLAATRVD
jgi:D-alanyl-D-alanine-carboxypeptidase/D-alanyl-D-alanine-endopeptidase